jgi:hypothetical protein
MLTPAALYSPAGHKQQQHQQEQNHAASVMG